MSIFYINLISFVSLKVYFLLFFHTCHRLLYPPHFSLFFFSCSTYFFQFCTHTPQSAPFKFHLKFIIFVIHACKCLCMCVTKNICELLLFLYTANIHTVLHTCSCTIIYIHISVRTPNHSHPHKHALTQSCLRALLSHKQRHIQGHSTTCHMY